MDKSDIEDKISNLRAGIAEVLIDMGTLEVDPDDYEDEYIFSLNNNGPVYVCGIAFDPACILKNMDETAYNNGLSDFVANIPVSETKEYKDLAEELEELEDELD